MIGAEVSHGGVTHQIMGDAAVLASSGFSRNEGPFATCAPHLSRAVHGGGERPDRGRAPRAVLHRLVYAALAIVHVGFGDQWDARHLGFLR